jgi:hypothetical protein
MNISRDLGTSRMERIERSVCMSITSLDWDRPIRREPNLSGMFLTVFCQSAHRLKPVKLVKRNLSPCRSGRWKAKTVRRLRRNQGRFEGAFALPNR